MSKGIPIACDLDCGGGCALLAHMEDGKIVKITDNPLSGKFLEPCIKGLQAQRTQYHPERLTKPLIRDGPRGTGKYREASWDEALDLVAEKLTETRETYGPESVIRLGGSGSVRGALHNTSDVACRFLSMYGGYTDKNLGYSAAAVGYTTPYMLGSMDVGLDAATLQHSELIILWGANVVDTRFGGMMESYIREAKQKGVQVIGVDPRKTRTIKSLCTEWIKVYPGTDTALMLALLNELIKNNKIDREYLSKYTHGFEKLENYVMGELDGVEKTPEWAEKICGTPREDIRELAELYSSHHPVALIPGLSIQRTIGGEDATRLSITLQAATGNIGILGGSTGSYSGFKKGVKVTGIDVPENPSGIVIPTYEWPDAILEGRKGGYPSDIKFIYNVGGNYLVQGSDIKKNIKAFKSVDFNVCHERFMTPTAMHCDVVLPVTTFLEREDIVSAGANLVLFSNKVHEPIPDTKHDYKIFAMLAKRLGFYEEYTENRSMDDWLRHFVEDSEITDYDEFKENGIYWGSDQKRVSLSEFIENPEKHPLETPSGKIQIASEDFKEQGGTLVPVYREYPATKEYPLRLVTPKSRYRVHSQNYNIDWFNEREPHRAWITPVDAENIEIENGDTILVSSPEGSTQIEAYITTDIMPGVVCIQEGTWPKFINGTEVNGSVNMLTSTKPTLPSHGSRTHSVLVQIVKA